jgi:hypothetical protein
MWEIFFDREGVEGDAMLPLIDAVAAGNVDEHLLERPRQQLADNGSASASTAC